MKKGMLCILLISYSALLLKPVIPYFSDAFAHIFWYSSHMATVHYTDGKLHVHKELIAESKEPAGKNASDEAKKSLSTPDYLLPVLPVLPENLPFLQMSFYDYHTSIPLHNLKADFPPPKTS